MKQLQIEYKKPWRILSIYASAKSRVPPRELRAARLQKLRFRRCGQAALARATIPADADFSLSVSYYNEIRTYFSTNY